MKSLRPGLIKRIHVDRRIMAQNLKRGQNKPAITIQTSQGPIKARQVDGGKFSVVQAGFNGRRPLNCGARIWIETRAEVRFA